MVCASSRKRCVSWAGLGRRAAEDLHCAGALLRGVPGRVDRVAIPPRPSTDRSRRSGRPARRGPVVGVGHRSPQGLGVPSSDTRPGREGPSGGASRPEGARVRAPAPPTPASGGGGPRPGSARGHRFGIPRGRGVASGPSVHHDPRDTAGRAHEHQRSPPDKLLARALRLIELGRLDTAVGRREEARGPRRPGGRPDPGGVGPGAGRAGPAPAATRRRSRPARRPLRRGPGRRRGGRSGCRVPGSCRCPGQPARRTAMSGSSSTRSRPGGPASAGTWA